ncbi:MAG: NAD-binding protein [Candidatus Thalassarchaeaceae archaeon]
MRIIIGGAGEVGRGVAAALRHEGRDIVLIDNDLDAINESQSIDCLVISGSVLSRRTLVKAGITDAEIVIMCTNSDELNLLSCAFAKRVFSEENKSSNRRIRTIARISDRKLLDPEYGAGPLPKWSKADHIVCAGEEIVSRLASGLVAPAFEEALPVHEGAYILVAEAGDGSPLIGSTVKEIRDTFSSLPPIVAIQTNGHAAKLDVLDQEIALNDRVAFAITSLDQFRVVSSALGIPLDPIPEHPRTLVFGATAFGSEVASHYLSEGADVVVIEPDLDLANQLVGSKVGSSKRLDVIHGDPQDEELLKEIGIEGFDVAVASMDDDNRNIAMAMQASDKGVPRSGLLLKDMALIEAVKRIGLTRPVSQRQITITSILRAIHFGDLGDFSVPTSLNDIVIVLFHIVEEHPFVDSTVENASNRLKGTMPLIFRESEEGVQSIVTSADTMIVEGDTVAMILKQEYLSLADEING